MKRLAIICGFIIIFIVILADTGHLGPIGVLYNFPYGDKVGHFLIFGLFSMIVNLSIIESRSISASTNHRQQGYVRTAIITSLIIAVFVGLEEFSQLFFPSRNASVFDLLASYLGIAFFTWLTLRIKR